MTDERMPMFSRPECHDSIQRAADLVASKLIISQNGFVYNLEPGDGTRYEFVCLLDMWKNRRVYVGVANFGPHGNGIYGYALDSFSVPEYVMEKTGITAHGSARVVADFINCLKGNLRNR